MKVPEHSEDANVLCTGLNMPAHHGRTKQSLTPRAIPYTRADMDTLQTPSWTYRISVPVCLVEGLAALALVPALVLPKISHVEAHGSHHSPCARCSLCGVVQLISLPAPRSLPGSPPAACSFVPFLHSHQSPPPPCTLEN